jgi:hypothetical protein
MSYPYVNPNHVKECNCEDYPCCGHTDNIPTFDSDWLYCDRCGMTHKDFECDDDEWEEDDEVPDGTE